MSARPTIALRHLRREDGIVVPLTVIVMTVALILVATAGLGANFSNDSANKDRQAKRAQQAADAGVSTALDRMNRLDLTHGAAGAAALQCVARAADGTLSIASTTSGTWCPAVTENLGNGETFSYRVQPVTQATGSATTTWKLVSTGTSNGVTRRTIVEATARTGVPIFADASVISLLDFNLENSAYIKGNVKSNGNIKFENSAQAACPSTVTPGPGKSVTPASSACNVGSTTSPVVLAPVNIGDADTNNSNSTICTTVDPCNGKKITWSTSTRRLNVDGGSVTLTGTQYLLCQLDMSGNSQLTIPSGAKVKIFIDSPENCGNNPAGVDVGGISFGNNSSVTVVDNDPTALQIYVVGSTAAGGCSSLPLPSAAKCAVRWDNHNTSYMMLYAPNSAVVISNHIDIYGAVAAKQIAMSNNTAIISDPRVGSVTTDDVYPVFKLQGYRECTPQPTGADPDSGC